jgi:catechol-2,3-dioxygenase
MPSIGHVHLRVRDLDRNDLEVYVDTRTERDRRAWQGRNEPFDPAAIGPSE